MAQIPDFKEDYVTKPYPLTISHRLFDNFHNNSRYENINVIVNMFIFDFLIHVEYGNSSLWSFRQKIWKQILKVKTLGGQSTVDYQIALSLHASMTSCY